MFVAVTISSCKKYLEITPQFVLGDNLVVSNLNGLENAVTGAFSQMASANLYGGGIIANSELLADWVAQGPGISAIQSDFALGPMYIHQMNAYNSQAGGMWGDGYAAINTANTVLQYLPNFQSQNPTTCNVLKGECLFIRAAMHYEMVRMFAQPWGATSSNSQLGVPIRLTIGTTSAGQSTPRSTVAQVYAQVIADLKSADSLLNPTSFPIGNPDWVSKYAAEAFLAKVYFSQNDFADANAYATKVINNASFGLNDSVNTVYSELGNNDDKEIIFQIINTAKNDPAAGPLHGRFYILYGYTVAEYAMSPAFAPTLQSSEAVGDLRYKKLFHNSFGAYFCDKYNTQYTNVAVVRLAEMYLTRAECEAQTGDLSDASTDYNKIRLRAGLQADLTMTQAGLINGIRGQRDIELSMEGDHYFEVKRRVASYMVNGLPVGTPTTFNTPGAGPIAWNSPTMIYPIPQQEVQENKSMVQNPGY
jgi:hypothetical protein